MRLSAKRKAPGPEGAASADPITADKKPETGARTLSLLLFAVFAAGWILQVFVLAGGELSSRAASSLVVTARVSSGGFIEAFINNEWSRSYRAKIVPGEKHRYVFEKIPPRIDSIRLDPTDALGADVEIESVELMLNGRPTGSVDAAALGKWARQGLDESGTGEGGLLKFRTSSTDPLFFGASLGLKLPDESAGDFIRSRLTVFLAGVLGLLLLLSGPGLRVAVPMAAAAAALYFSGETIGAFVDSLELPAASARQAVGFASYVGRSKAAEQYFVIIAFALALVTGGITAFLPLRADAEEIPVGKKFAWMPLSALVTLFAVIMFPTFTASREAIRTATHDVVGFDWGNVFIWDYLYHYGFLPYRDFWFPYAGDVGQLSGFPESAWAIYLVQLVLFSALLVSLYELCGRTIVWPLLILAGVGLGITNGTFLATKRYLPLIAAVSCGAALVARLPVRTFPFAVYGTFLGWIFWRDPTLLVYSAPVLLLYLAAGLFRSYRLGRAVAWVWNGALTFVFLAVIVGTKIATLAFQGQWIGFVNFYERLPYMSAAGSVPSPVLEWFGLSVRYENVLFYGMCVFAALGVQLWLSRGNSRRKNTGLLLFGISLVTFSLFLKFVVRPHMAQQIICFVFISAAIALRLLASEWPVWRNTVLCLLLGILAGRFHEEAKGFVRRSGNRIATLPTDLEFLNTGLRTSREEFDRYYAPERFHGFDQEFAQVVSFLEAKNLPRFSRDLLVVGDEVLLYPLLKAQPCPFISLYDGANIWAQQEQVECLSKHPPRHVVWDTNEKMFDQVPNTVRDPIVISYLATSFVPEERFGRFVLLRPRKGGEAFDMVFWKNILGPAVDLGEIPLLTTGPELGDCRGDCLDYLQIEFPPLKGTIEIEAGGQAFQVNWSLSRGTERGYIALDRLWFWNAAKKEKLPYRIVTAPLGSKVVSKEIKPDLLY